MLVLSFDMFLQEGAGHLIYKIRVFASCLISASHPHVGMLPTSNEIARQKSCPLQRLLRESVSQQHGITPRAERAALGVRDIGGSENPLRT